MGHFGTHWDILECFWTFLDVFFDVFGCFLFLFFLLKNLYNFILYPLKNGESGGASRWRVCYQRG